MLGDVDVEARAILLHGKPKEPSAQVVLFVGHRRSPKMRNATMMRTPMTMQESATLKEGQ